MVTHGSSGPKKIDLRASQFQDWLLFAETVAELDQAFFKRLKQPNLFLKLLLILVRVNVRSVTRRMKRPASSVASVRDRCAWNA